MVDELSQLHLTTRLMHTLVASEGQALSSLEDILTSGSHQTDRAERAPIYVAIQGTQTDEEAGVRGFLRTQKGNETCQIKQNTRNSSLIP
jgi:hypothetical protein